jgi:aspartate 1-decarboxylase
MQVTLLRAKLHRAIVTGGHVDYEGSLTISRDLAELAGFRAYERILVGNMANGQRFETYVILGEAGKGEIMAFGQFTPEEAERHQPVTVQLDEKNRVVRKY